MVIELIHNLKAGQGWQPLAILCFAGFFWTKFLLSFLEIDQKSYPVNGCTW